MGGNNKSSTPLFVSPVCQGRPATVICNSWMERARRGAGFHKNFS